MCLVFQGVSVRQVTRRQVSGQSLETGWRRTAHLPPSAPIAFYLTIRREPHNPAARGRCFIHRIRAEGRVSSGRLTGDGFNRPRPGGDRDDPSAVQGASLSPPAMRGADRL